MTTSFKTLTIKRTHSTQQGTFGVFDDDGFPFAVSVELPWKDNQNNISCIPEGSYTIKRIVSPKFGETFEVLNVFNRSNILIHCANTINDLLGCIGIGEQFSVFNNLTGVGMSKIAFSELMDRMKGIESATLNIVNRF